MQSSASDMRAPTSSLLHHALALVAAATLVACGDDDPNIRDVDPDDDGLLRVVHASPDAPAVDIFVVGDDDAIAKALEYGETSRYEPIDKGSYRIQLRAAGTSTVVFESDAIQISAGAKVTAIAAGSIASTDPADTFRLIPVIGTETGPNQGQVLVRVIHAGSDAPTVAIDLDDDGSVELPALERFGVTDVDAIALPIDQSLQVGVLAGGRAVTAFTLPGLPSLDVGSELLVIATGRLADLPRQDTGFGLLVVGPDGTITFVEQNPTLYALHASPDAPAVDLRLAGVNAAVNDLSFGELVPIQVPPGDYALSILAAGSTNTTPVATANIQGLEAGERYLAIAAGMLTPAANEAPFTVLQFREQFELDANPRLRLVHASPDAPAIDVSTVTGTTLSSPALIEDFTFGEATDETGVAVAPAARVNVGVATANSQAAVATFTLNTTGSPRSFLIAAGALTPAAGEQGFRLLQVNTTTNPWSVSAINAN